MSESAFDGWSINEDDINEDSSTIVEPSDVKPVLCPFTILVDSREQKPYQFDSIIGDYRDDYAPLIVKTKKKGMTVADYSIDGLPGIAIERKSKEDLFGSVANGQKRENFIKRLHKMKETLLYGAIVIECYPEEIYENPPSYTSLSPKTVFRTTLSWAVQFPTIHFHWCKDREKAEQTTFRLLEKFYEHETNTKYKAHNKPLDACIEAYELGIKSRMVADEIQAAYCKDNPLRVFWMRGWQFWSTRVKDGDMGTVYEIGEVAPSQVAEALVAHKAKKGKSDKIKPLPNQTSFLNPDEEEESPLVEEIVNNIKKSRKSKIKL